jgi:hypothetical protein
MTTENIQTQENTDPNVPEHTDVEKRAIEMGWRPLSEFDGDEADFIDAKEFVGRKPLYDKISSTTKELKAVRNAVEALKELYTKVQETEYKRALTTLKDERKKALVEGDADRFQSLDDEIKIKLTTIYNDRLKIKIIDLLTIMCKYYGSIYRNFLKFIFNDTRYRSLDRVLI